ncbi:MAG: hypothetical protein H6691_06020 [Gemmatimonadales bacterium]|nr:hypothetical protein [Gemmatimonadales bacterium]
MIRHDTEALFVHACRTVTFGLVFAPPLLVLIISSTMSRLLDQADSVIARVAHDLTGRARAVHPRS